MDVKTSFAIWKYINSNISNNETKTVIQESYNGLNYPSEKFRVGCDKLFFTKTEVFFINKWREGESKKEDIESKKFKNTAFSDDIRIFQCVNSLY